MILLIFKNEAQPTLQPFEPSDQSLPLLVREHFKNACDELMPLGFEYIAVKGCLFDDLAEAVSAKADSPLVARSTGSTTTRGIGISQPVTARGVGIQSVVAECVISTPDYFPYGHVCHWSNSQRTSYGADASWSACFMQATTRAETRTGE